MNKKPSKFSPEVRERAVRFVREPHSEHPSMWAATESIAPMIGCTPQTLLDWVKRDEVDRGVRDGVSTDERGRLKALEREVKELRRANEILKIARAFFAQAELDCYRRSQIDPPIRILLTQPKPPRTVSYSGVAPI